MPAFPPNLCRRGLVPAWVPLPYTTPGSVIINGTTVTMIVHNTVTCRKQPDRHRRRHRQDRRDDPAYEAPYYGFTITVTNVGALAVFQRHVDGHRPPNGMTFSPSLPCPSGPFTAGQTFSCSLSSLPSTITINATPTGTAPFPPYTNTATVSVNPSSGYVDSNPGNNSATVTVAKPAACCTPPATLNSDGICTCPPPQVLQYSNGGLAGTCVNPSPPPPPVCTPPQVMIPGVGCRCPDDEVLVNGKCIKPLVCERPLVPNATTRTASVRTIKSCAAGNASRWRSRSPTPASAAMSGMATCASRARPSRVNISARATRPSGSPADSTVGHGGNPRGGNGPTGPVSARAASRKPPPGFESPGAVNFAGAWPAHDGPSNGVLNPARH